MFVRAESPICLILAASLVLGCRGPEAEPPGTDDDDGTEDSTIIGESPQIVAIEPEVTRGGLPFTLFVTADTDPAVLELLLDGVPLPASVEDGRMRAELDPLPRGLHTIAVREGALLSTVVRLAVLNTAPTFLPPPPQVVREEEELLVELDVADFDGDVPRVFLTGLPPGARFDEGSRLLRYRPDFIAGPATFTVVAAVQDDSHRITGSFTLTVEDAVRPPPPVVTSTQTAAGSARLTLEQESDDFLDSAGYAGRSYLARVAVPLAASADDRRAVKIELHAFGGWPSLGGSADEFRIFPHDPDNTYWYGYSNQLPGGDPDAPGAITPPYTMRRVLALLEWVLDTYPGADPDRVYVSGAGMGGAGASTLGLLAGRHFASVEATISQTIPRHHRPERLEQLSGLWGSPDANPDDGAGMGCWDRLDLTRALLEEPGAADQQHFFKHGKDDGVVHFGAAVVPSPRTGRSFYEALQDAHAGHYAVWDEGGHGSADPWLPVGWWDGGWDPMEDEVTFLKRSLAFPAFARSSLDRDPGDGSGNGAVEWSAVSGYAGSPWVVGDTGWTGEIAGAINRSLRWDAEAIIDTIDVFSVPLRVLDGSGGPAPAPGYPTTGDRLDGELPVWVDVTPRRVQAFVAQPGEDIGYTFGAASGVVLAGPGGVVTVPGLAVEAEWQTLRLERVRPR